MFDFLYHLNDTTLLIVLSIFTVSVSLCIALAVMKLIPHELRFKDNSVIGNIGAFISIIYGVLVGFAALYLLNVNDMASDSVQQEASTVTHLVRDGQWLRPPYPVQIKQQAKKYLNLVINVEWPLMEYQQDNGIEGDLIVEQIDTQLRNYQINSNMDFFIIRNITEDVKSLYDARQKRIQMSSFAFNQEMWVVIIIGTILAVLINCLFAMNKYMHLITVSFIALMAAAMLYLLISLDRPFTGEFSVDPMPLKAALTYIEKIAR